MADNGQFFSRFAKDAQIASAATGVLRSVILAQWADETAYGTSSAFTSGWNFAGVSYGGSVNGFPTEQAGLDAYIQVLNQSNYDGVRSERGDANQCIALGKSGWAASGYDMADYQAGLPISNPGVDLFRIINDNNLTRYDPGGSGDAGSSVFGTFGSSTSPVSSLGTTILPPLPGMTSDIGRDSFIINGTTMDVDVSNALVNASLDLDISAASVLTLTLHDPTRTLINNAVFNQKSSLNLDGLEFELVAIEKQGAVLTATFEPWVVAALRSATGSFTVSPGQMTRTEFASLLVGQVQGAVFSAPPPSFLYSLDQGYARATQEQISRGTVNAPLEDSWTCLQRLAAEIGFRCFEYYGTVYFGPDSWLIAQPVAITLAEFTAGTQTIDGTYDTGQPLGTVDVTAVVDSWFSLPGQSVAVAGLGPFSQQSWLVSTVSRASLFVPDLTVTLEQPQPSLPEPAKGGAKAAVGAGFAAPGGDQSTGGVASAAAALAYAKNMLGKPYIWGGENPQTGFDCSGLMQAAYGSAGVTIPRTSQAQQTASPAVPAGAINLKPGDLVFFGITGQPATHVEMFVSYNAGTGVATMIGAEHTGTNVMYDTFDPTIGAGWGGDVYLGATRPAQ